MRKWIFLLLVSSVLSAGLVLAQEAAVDTGPPDDNPNEFTIPEGTEFKLQLHTTISSKTTKAGDRVLTTLLDPVSVEDRDVLPKGVRVDGHVGEVKQAGRRGKGGLLTIVFDTVELPNGEKLAIIGSLTEVYSNKGGSTPNVGPEGELKGKGPSRKQQAVIMAAPAVAGAAAGGIGLGIVGAAAGITAGILLPKGQQAALEAGSLVGMRLDRDVIVTPAQDQPAGAPAPASPTAQHTANSPGQ
jgi:hypothetical protein